MEHVGLDPAQGRGQPRAEVELGHLRQPADADDLDRAVALDDRRAGLVVDRQDPDVQPQLGLGAGQRPDVRLDAPGGRGIIFA